MRWNQWLYHRWLKQWYSPQLTGLMLLLMPLSLVFFLLSQSRKWYQRKTTVSLNVPVIVVGNITVGGTGKTPLVILLAKILMKSGYAPAVITRGYGACKKNLPYRVQSEDQSAQVGDEALLLAQNLSCPIIIDKQRCRAAEFAIAKLHCNVVISDDGLQHYRLSRDIEIIMLDGERGIGNGQLLPAGPLREKVSRINDADYFIITETLSEPLSFPAANFSMQIMPREFISLSDHKICDIRAWPHKIVHAVAGIGNPERFFNMLKHLGLEIIPHAFSDHYVFKPQELQFADAYPILMTEKDAVKCKDFANPRLWYVAVEAHIDPIFFEKILNQLKLME